MQDGGLIDITIADDVSVVVFRTASICDIAQIDNLSKELKKYIADNRPRKLVIDFAQVKFFTSQTLGLLLDIWRKLQATGGQIAISGINPQLHRVFKITNLDKLFKFFPDSEAAMKSMAETKQQ